MSDDIIYLGFDELAAHGYTCDYIRMKHFNDGSSSVCMPAFDLEDCIQVAAPKGTRLVFINKNGYESERHYANERIGENSPVTVTKTIVGGSSSKYEFVEFPGEKFNTVMFEKYQDR